MSWAKSIRSKEPTLRSSRLESTVALSELTLVASLVTVQPILLTIQTASTMSQSIAQ